MPISTLSSTRSVSVFFSFWKDQSHLSEESQAVAVKSTVRPETDTGPWAVPKHHGGLRRASSLGQQEVHRPVGLRFRRSAFVFGVRVRRWVE